MHLYSAERAEDLAERLAEVLVDDPLDPMESEWMAVPTVGLRRWLMIQLAGRLGASDPDLGDGIAANFDVALPADLLDNVLRADAPDGDDRAWSLDRIVWPLLDLADSGAHDPQLAEFVRLPPSGSRYSRARRVADLFDRYHRHRPTMVRAWWAGDDIDATGGRIDSSLAWQPHLWRALRVRIGLPSPPERLPGALERLRSGALRPALPGRLHFFGFTSLPGTGFSELIQAVGAHVDVRVFLLEPSAFDVTAMLRKFPRPAPGQARLRAADPTAELVRHPLLRSWGRVPREAAVLLADATADGLPPIERLVADDDGGAPDTLLTRLQRALRSDEVPTARSARADDRSLGFHACFGAMRQVQVARDALLHLLADESTGLSEEDVLVLCPRLDRFAPLVEAVFGGGSGAGEPADGPPSLRFTIADQSIRSVNPVIGAAATLLELVVGRFEAADVLDFLALAPVRKRFGIDDDDLAKIARWVGACNVRWGLDAEHRELFGVTAAVDGYSWQAALDRLLLGTAVEDGSFELAIGGVAAHGIDGGDVEVLGRLAEVVTLLADLSRASRQPRTASQWVDLVWATCSSLFDAPTDQAWQMQALASIVASARDQAQVDGAPSTTVVDYLDIRRFLGRMLDDSPGRPGFFRGGITVTSMAPLRWVPFRVVCILGMDQDAFGVPPASTEDLLAAMPQLGDPDARSDDRQRLLEAVLAARDHLVVVREGRDVRTNQEVRPSVVATELFEAVLALVPGGEQEALRSALEIVHTRHSFDPAALARDRPWSFDPVDRLAATARAHRPATAPPLVPRPLSIPEIDVVELDDLRSFLTKPVPYFVRSILGIRLPDPVEAPPMQLPVAIDSLEQWHVGTRLLDARLHGRSYEEWLAWERAASSLPPGSLSTELLADVHGTVEAILAELALREVAPSVHTHVSIDVLVDERTRVVGSVPLRLGPATPGSARSTYSKLKPVHKLEAWLDLMALQAQDPDQAWRSIVAGRSPTTTGEAEVVDLVSAHEPPERGVEARRALGRMVDCFRRGRREPIPLFPTLSYHLHAGDAAPKHWSAYAGGGDASDRDTLFAFGELGFHDVLALPVEPHDPQGTGGRAHCFAEHLWSAYDRSVVPVGDEAPSGSGGPSDHEGGR